MNVIMFSKGHISTLYIIVYWKQHLARKDDNSLIAPQELMKY